jgi:hypothetical protein
VTVMLAGWSAVFDNEPVPELKNTRAFVVLLVAA